MTVRKLKVLETAAQIVLFIFRCVLPLSVIVVVPWLAGNLALALADYLWTHKFKIGYAPNWLFWVVDLPFAAILTVATIRYVLGTAKASPKSLEISKATALVLPIFILTGVIQLAVDQFPKAVMLELVAGDSTAWDDPGNLRIYVFAKAMSGMIMAAVFAAAYPMLAIATDRHRYDWNIYNSIVRTQFVRLWLLSMLLITVYKGFEMTYFKLLAPFIAPINVNMNPTFAKMVTEYFIHYTSIFPVTLLSYMLPPVGAALIYKAVMSLQATSEPKPGLI